MDSSRKMSGDIEIIVVRELLLMAKQKILVVDDQLGIRLLLTEVFTKNGYDVHTARTGTEALEKFKRLPIDLAILDYQLPDVDGLAVVKRLKEKNCQVPLIFMSGLMEKLTEKPTSYKNIVKIIPKPFDIEHLLVNVTTILA